MTTDPSDLLDLDSYQVFLMTCPALLPFSFAVHPWFVVNRKGAVSRWAIGIRALDATRTGYLNKNANLPFEGLPLFFPFRHPRWKGKIRGYLEGDEGSLAARMAEYIEEASSKYPFRDTYSLLGPNSNTYVQWILNQFPASELVLPWNAIGKRFSKS